MHMEKLVCIDQFGFVIEEGITACGSFMNDPINGHLQIHTKPFFELYAWYQDLENKCLSEG